MTDVATGPDDGIPSTGEFDLQVPASAPYLDVVRTATAGLAARLRFNTYEIEDLRNAVNEACVMVLSLPRPRPTHRAPLTCRFEVLPDAVAVTISAAVGKGAAMPDSNAFIWELLTTYAVDVDGSVERGTARVVFRKPRRP